MYAWCIWNHLEMRMVSVCGVFCYQCCCTLSGYIIMLRWCQSGDVKVYFKFILLNYTVLLFEKKTLTWTQSQCPLEIQLEKWFKWMRITGYSFYGELMVVAVLSSGECLWSAFYGIVRNQWRLDYTQLQLLSKFLTRTQTTVTTTWLKPQTILCRLPLLLNHLLAKTTSKDL